MLDDGSRRYVWGLGLAYSVDTTGAVQVYHTDGLGSVRALTDGTGQVVQTYQTDEFGVTTLTQGNSTQPFRYSGEPRDETGLINLRARMYDPATGRSLSRDTFPGVAGAPGSLNRYAYVGNNPVNHTDPSGQICFVCVAGAIWLGIEFGLFGHDAINMAEIAVDPSVSLEDKQREFNLFATGAVGPGPSGIYKGGARFIARSSGAVLDVSQIRIPGPRNSPFGKLDYLLGRVPSQESRGKGIWFADRMGFTDEDLELALRQHLIDNFEGATIRGSRITVNGAITTPGGRRPTLRSVWQVMPDGSVDFITAFPD